MGKSPGKWIKTVLFGKKHSKSTLSKGAANTKVENLAGDSSLVTDPPELASRDAENTGFGKGANGTPYDSTGLYPGNQDVDLESNYAPVPSRDAEMVRQEQAATKTQAAFRGYLARRAFRALKGIIRLQALIRGHLVRRQAVATLRCMQGIVKLQAVARGRRVRLSNTLSGWCKKYNIVEFQDAKQVGNGASSYLGSENLATKPFVCKLLIQLPTALRLSLQYDTSEPNSAWNWLERWSISRFWKPCAHSKNVLIKNQQKQGGAQAVEFRTGKSKRSIRKAPAHVNGDTGSSASVDADKPKRNPRKVTSHQTELVQEQPQSEFERVKRNLRKVSASAAVASEKSETQNEKPEPLPSTNKVLNTAAPDVPEQKKVIYTENPTGSDDIEDKPALDEIPSNITAFNEPIDVPQDDHPVAELHSLENGGILESPLTLNEGIKEENINKENQKIKKRRSLTTTQEHPENILQNSPCVPSYMAATASAKAKLRAQGSSKIDEDGADHDYARRHSLPTSSNGKLSSLSPRIQKPIQAHGKGGNKPSRPLTVSKDDKTPQPGWRR